MTPSEPILENATDESPEESAPAFHRQHHMVFLALSVVVVVMAYLLVVVSGDRVAFRGFEDWPLPHTCAFRIIFGTGCPGCGLTRGTIHFANGRLTESFAMHPLAFLFALWIVAQIPYRLLCLARENQAPLGRRFPLIALWSLIVLYIGNWLLGFLIAG